MAEPVLLVAVAAAVIAAACCAATAAVPLPVALIGSQTITIEQNNRPIKSLFIEQNKRSIKSLLLKPLESSSLLLDRTGI